MTTSATIKAAAVALALCASVEGSAEVVRLEVLSFQASTFTDQQVLTGSKEGKPVTLSGVLRLTRPAPERLPVVVLLHGSGGIASYVTDWENDLNAMGISTFVTDHFSGRGLVSTVFDQSQIAQLQMVPDSYRALEMLAKHPRVDPARIVLMGFSMGGRGALYASLKRFQQNYLTSGQEFAAYIPFYPPCSTSYKGDEDVSDKPIRIFHGEADDWVPVEPCRSYVERLRAKGKDVQLTEYQGAGHVFDGAAVKQRLKIEKAQTGRNCQLAEEQDGVVVNTKTKQPFTFSDPCVEHGASIGYNEKASTESRRAVKEFLTTTLKLK